MAAPQLRGLPARRDAHAAAVVVDRADEAPLCLVEVALEVGHDAARVERVGGDAVGSPVPAMATVNRIAAVFDWP